MASLSELLGLDTEAIVKSVCDSFVDQQGNPKKPGDILKAKEPKDHESFKSLRPWHEKQAFVKQVNAAIRGQIGTSAIDALAARATEEALGIKL